jgi:hypothetical protein
MVGLDAAKGLPVTPRGHYTHLPTTFRKELKGSASSNNENTKSQSGRCILFQETSPALE